MRERYSLNWVSCLIGAAAWLAAFAIGFGGYLLWRLT